MHHFGKLLARPCQVALTFWGRHHPEFHKGAISRVVWLLSSAKKASAGAYIIAGGGLLQI